MENQIVPAQEAKSLAKSPRDIKDLIQSKEFEQAVAAALPKHLKIERFMRVALNAILRQPELRECSKESFFLRMLELSSLGIEPDGRRAHLIPFWNNNFCVCNHTKEQHNGPRCSSPGCGCQKVQSRRDVQLIVDYKGIAELVRRSGDVSYMHCDEVFEGDEWDFTYGSGAFLKHKPNLMSDNRGKRIAVYSFVKLRDGNEDFIVMPISEVEKVRLRSKAKDSGPWKTDFGEMAKKTCFRRHSKWLPLSPETKDAVEADDDAADVIDAVGALSAGGMIGAESVSEHDARIEHQMNQQAEEAQAELKRVTQGQVEEVIQQKASASPDATKPPDDEPQRVRGAHWPDRPAMLADLKTKLAQLGEPLFWKILGSNGIDNEEMIVLNARGVVDAAEEMDRMLVPPKQEEAKAPGDKPVFGRKKV